MPLNKKPPTTVDELIGKLERMYGPISFHDIHTTIALTKTEAFLIIKALRLVSYVRSLTRDKIDV